MEPFTIVGAGGIGCAVGYALRAAGSQVLFVDVQLEKIRWGGLHGVFLCGERFLKRVTERWRLPSGVAFKLLMALVTYTLLQVTWVLFRAKTFAAALTMLGAMVGLHSHPAAVLPLVKILETLVCSAGLLSVQWYMRDKTMEDVVTQFSPRVVAAAWACMTFAIIITQGRGDAFIYFQF